MSNNASAVIEKMVSGQLQKINDQLKANPPLPLPKSATQQTVISSIPAQGYVISSSGTYVLESNITWTPQSALSAAIYITCSNVVLNMNGWSITAEGAENANSIGILIANAGGSCNNVSIQNGSLVSMGYNGVTAVNTTQLSLSKVTVNGLTHTGFNILPNGICLLAANNFLLDTCTVTNVSVQGISASGFFITGSTQGVVTGCNVTNFTNNDGVGAGFVYFLSSGIQTLGCNVTNLNTFYGGNPLSVVGHTCIGFMPTQSQNLTYTLCTATGITGRCDDCHGMSLFNVESALVIGFAALNVSDGNCPQKTGAKATGLEVYGNNITIMGCIAKNITAMVPQDLQSTGFSACGTGISFEDCYAEKVVVVNSDNVPDTAFGNGTGFGWAPDPRPQFCKPAISVTYTNCHATDCQVGFDTWNHQNSTWSNPHTPGCPVTILNQPKDAVRTYSMNFCSELPNSNPSSPAQQFPITNCAENNTFPNG